MPESPIGVSDNGQLESPLLWLPDEIWLKILSYFTWSPKELTRFSVVSKKWLTLCFDPSLWKRLNLANTKISPGKLCAILQRVPGVQTLSLRSHEELSVSGVAVFAQHMQNVVDLDLGFSNVNSVMMRLFLCHCRKLRSLNVEGARDFQDDALETLMDQRRLSTLNFSHCALRDEKIRDLVQALPRITNLNIDGISWVTDELVQSLVQHHTDCLQRLYLDGAELTDVSIAALKQCHNLTHLSVSFCELLTDAALIYVQALEKLCFLRLKRGTEFSSSGIMAVFQSGCFPNLKHLDLSECCQLDDFSVFAICKSVGPNLSSLLLGWCWCITDDGLITIVDNCKHLQTLDIIGLDKVKGDCFDRLPEEIPNLHFLNLQQCNRINDSLIIEVIRQKPDLRVVNYYGEEFIHGNYVGYAF